MHLAHTDYGVSSSKVMMWLVTNCRRMFAYPRKALWGRQDSNHHINTEAYINILIQFFFSQTTSKLRVLRSCRPANDCDCDDRLHLKILEKQDLGSSNSLLSSWQFHNASVMRCLWKLSLGSCHTGERVPSARVSNQGQTAQEAVENCVVAE